MKIDPNAPAYPCAKTDAAGRFIGYNDGISIRLKIASGKLDAMIPEFSGRHWRDLADNAFAAADALIDAENAREDAPTGAPVGGGWSAPTYDHDAIRKLSADKDAAQKRIAKLEAALKRHGNHDDTCASTLFRDPKPCNCGFNASLSEEA